MRLFVKWNIGRISILDFDIRKNLCKASHKFFYDKFIVMRSHGKCISDYQNVTFLLLVSALHNNMVAMTSIRLKVRTNGYQKAFFKRFSAIFAY